MLIDFLEVKDCTSSALGAFRLRNGELLAFLEELRGSEDMCRTVSQGRMHIVLSSIFIFIIG